MLRRKICHDVEIHLVYDRKYKQFYWSMKCIINEIRNHTTSVESCAGRYPATKVQSSTCCYQRAIVLLYDHNIIDEPHLHRFCALSISSEK